MVRRLTLFKFKNIIVCFIVISINGKSVALQTSDGLHCDEGQFSSPVGGCHPCSICYLMVETGKVAHGCKEQCHKNVIEAMRQSDDLDAGKNPSLSTKSNPDKGYSEKGKSDTIGKEIKDYIVILIMIIFLMFAISIFVLMWILCHRREIREYKLDTMGQYHTFQQHGAARFETKGVLTTDVISVTAV